MNLSLFEFEVIKRKVVTPPLIYSGGMRNGFLLNVRGPGNYCAQYFYPFNVLTNMEQQIILSFRKI